MASRFKERAFGIFAQRPTGLPTHTGSGYEQEAVTSVSVVALWATSANFPAPRCGCLLWEAALHLLLERRGGLREGR